MLRKINVDQTAVKIGNYVETRTTALVAPLRVGTSPAAANAATMAMFAWMAIVAAVSLNKLAVLSAALGANFASTDVAHAMMVGRLVVRAVVLSAVKPEPSV